MKRIVSALVISALAAGGGYAFYRYGLSDQDRESLSRTIKSAQDLLQELRTRVQPIVDEMTHSDEVDITANREDTQQQWAELGF